MPRGVKMTGAKARKTWLWQARAVSVDHKSSQRIAYCDICHSTCGASGSEDSKPDDWFFNILCGWNFSTSL